MAKYWLGRWALVVSMAVAAGCGADTDQGAETGAEGHATEDQATGTSGAGSAGDVTSYQPDNTHGTLRAKLENTMKNEFGPDKYDIYFDVADDGNVTINGRVDTDAEKKRVEMLTSATQGVVGVVNNLEVGPER